MNGKPRIEVAAGIIREGNRLLITKRRRGSDLAGLWEFPGGKRESNESLESCLRRELQEELGVEISAPAAFHHVRYEYEDKLVDLHFFTCSIQRGQPRTIQCDEVRWVEAADLGQYRFPPADSAVLELLTSGEGKGHRS